MRTSFLLVILAGLIFALLPSSLAADPVVTNESDPPGSVVNIDTTKIDMKSTPMIWAEKDGLVSDNAHRRIEFNAEGVRLTPRHGGVANPRHAVGCRLVEVRSGGYSHLNTSAIVSPIAVDHQVDYIHENGITERYAVDESGIEQLVVFDKPLSLDGDLELEVQFDTELDMKFDGPFEGVSFNDGQHTVVHYSEAVVLDASGRQSAAPLKLDGKRLTITVPNDWLDKATYPVTVDPRLIGVLIYIGNDDDQNDVNPAVAYSTSSNQYLVVYKVEGSEPIYGRFVDGASGQTLGNRFFISSDYGMWENDSRNPDVAYDPLTDRFLVVWDEELLDWEVEWVRVVSGRLVYGSRQPVGDQVLGTSGVTIGYMAGEDMTEPAVAYNSADGQYVVVFSVDDHDTEYTDGIKGRMLQSNTTSPGLLGAAPFYIMENDDYNRRRPDVAWSSHGNTFLVVYTAWANTGHEPDKVQMAFLHDTFQSSGFQRCSPSDLIVAPLPGTVLTNGCVGAAVAYDPAAQYYVVVFEHGDGPDAASSWGKRVTSSYSGPGTYFPDGNNYIAIGTEPTFPYHIEPTITFGVGGLMYVAYLSDDPGIPFSRRIHMRTLNGRVVSSPFLIYHDIVEPGYDLHLASSSMGQALVVWHVEWPGNFDVVGQFVEALYESFLPVVLKNN